MSSVSQEDLDAGWDEEPEQSAAAKAESPRVASQSVPPNSITIEKSPAPLESIVVLSAPDNAEISGSNATGAAPLAPPDVTVTESAELAPGVEALARAPSDPVAIDPPPNEAASGPLAQPPAQAIESDVGQSEPPASGSVAIAQSALAEAPSSLDTSAPAEPPISQLELFTAVTEKPQLLAEKWVDTHPEVEPAASESAAEVAAITAESEPMVAPAVLQEPDVPAVEDAPESRGSSVSPQAAADLPLPPAAVAVTSSAGAETYAVRHWRTIALAAAAALVLVVGLLAIRSKHAQARHDQLVVQPKIGDTQAVNVAPMPVSNPKPPAPVEIGAPEPAHPAAVTGAQAESFSDAFVKHAATANSSWADMKKRPRVVDSSQSNRPSAASNASANDNPLDVLDKLEKARRAKKSVAK